MSRQRSAIGASTLIFACLALHVSTCDAGPLDGHPDAFFSGSTAFADVGISGFVDFAVFTQNGFSSAGYSTAGIGGWTPNADLGFYTYQVFLDGGSAPVSQFSVSVTEPASNPGAFETGLAGTAPSTATLPLGSATFTFTPVFPVNSSGLVFQSDTRPVLRFGSVFDSGLSSFVIPLPTPGSVYIPEPSTALLLWCGLGALSIFQFRRRRRHMAR